MASRILYACKAITNCAKITNVKHNVTTISLLKPINQVLLLQNPRNSSFYMKKTAAELWKGVTSVSNPGRRRGRGKGVPKIRDLNKGQRLGCGKIPIIFPGLNAPVALGDIMNKQRYLTPEEQENNFPVKESQLIIPKRLKIHPLERGYSGKSLAGRKIGPPGPVNDVPFKGFESWVLFSKYSSVMSSVLGRSKRNRCLVITGNRNGIAGFSMVSSSDIKSCMEAAKTKAGQRLIYIERYNNHTVLHDFFTQFARTKIFVEQKPKGYGLKCHRVIRTCCEALGIMDLYAKIEGSTNVPNIVKAFFIGLLQQKTYQQMADEKKMHLVERRKENAYYPTVLASPTTVRDNSQIPSNEILNFKLYVMNGKVRLKRKHLNPFYMQLPTWLVHLRKKERCRGHDEVRLKLKAEYGDICSFLYEKYPEARVSKWRKHDKKEGEEDAGIES